MGNSRKGFTLVELVVGITVMIMLLRLPTSTLRKYSVKLFGFALFLLALTLVPGIGVSVNGARRWLNLPGFRFQPVELMLLAVPVLMAKQIAKVIKKYIDL